MGEADYAGMRRRCQASARLRGRAPAEDVDEVGASFGAGDWEDECSGFRPAATSRSKIQARASSRWDTGREDDDEGFIYHDDSSVSARKSGLQPGQMGPVTKTLLGVLIALLFFNLYLKPLVRQFTG